MAKLADILRQTGYAQDGTLVAPATESPMTKALSEHIKTLPQQLATNQAALDSAIGSWNKTDFGTGLPNPNYRPEAIAELTQLMPNMMGTFIGAGSKLWNPKLAFEAAKLEKQGVPAEEIWRLTGTGRGLDNQFRQEISDAEMKFHPETLNSLRRSKEFDKLYEPWTKDTPYLYDLIEHKKLREAYPASADTTILRGSNDWGGSSSPYAWADVTLNVAPARNTKEKLANISEMESTLLHELQHQVQSAEGFAKGGNVDEFKEIIPPKDVLTRLHKLQAEFEALPGGSPERIAKVMEHRKLADKYTPFGQYERLAGEAEARTTANRQKLTDAERRANYPFKEGKYGLDVPLDEILIRQFGEPIISRKELIEQQIKKLKD